MNECKPVALGISCAIVWAAGVFLLGLTAMFGWGNAFVDVLASLYLGYGASIAGAFIGAVWALVDGFIAGALIGWIYNRVAR